MLSQRALRGDVLGALSAASDGYERGWLLTALGRYGAALAALDGAPTAGVVAAAACATRAAILRQVSLHDRAEDADRDGLARLGPVGGGGDRTSVDATAEVTAALRIGLVADAVGCGGDPATLLRRLGDARAATAAAPAWRQRLRLAWVTGEVAVVTGDWDRATASFEEAVAVARRNGARRHEAKSLAFAAAAGNARGDAATALRVAVAAGRLARSLRALPVVWPAALVAADAATALSDDGAAAQHRGVAADVLRVVVDTLPADLRAAALRRPPAAALLA